MLAVASSLARASGCRLSRRIIVDIRWKGFIGRLTIPAGVDTVVQLIANAGIMGSRISAAAVVLNGAKMVTIGGYS